MHRSLGVILHLWRLNIFITLTDGRVFHRLFNLLFFRFDCLELQLFFAIFPVKRYILLWMQNHTASKKEFFSPPVFWKLKQVIDFEIHDLNCFKRTAAVMKPVTYQWPSFIRLILLFRPQVLPLRHQLRPFT